MAKENLVLADKNEADLIADRTGMENEYQQMKFDHAVKGLGNPMDLRQLRRDIARINTELRVREIGALSVEEVEMRSKIRDRRRRQK